MKRFAYWITQPLAVLAILLMIVGDILGELGNALMARLPRRVR